MRKIVFLILAVVLSSACKNTAQSTLQEIESLGLNIQGGKIQAFYSDGFEERAQETVDLLQDATAYFAENFQVTRTFSLAVLDSMDWIKISSIPYGLPFVSGPPYVVCIPAGPDNILARMVSGGLAASNLPGSYSMGREAFADLFVSFIGFHELGHIYAKDLGMSFPDKWIDELTATYLAYCYLHDEQSGMDQLWLDASELLVDKLKPEYRSISDFEDLYVRVGVENYAWYQMVFLQRVGEVHGQMGKDFLEVLRDHKWSENASEHHFNDMEGLSPGFMAWGSEHGLLE